MLLLNAQSLSKRYDHRALFDGISLTLHAGECVGLIGPNGAGKTTLLRILSGLEEPDDGAVERGRSVRTAYVAQEEAFSPKTTVESALLEALRDDKMNERERLTRTRTLMGKIGFPDGNARVETLSGGWKKRLAIACQLVKEPDVLLLDEPTNHLDLEGIAWLESILENAPFAFVLVSHDRYLLEKITTRVVEISPRYPDGCYSVRGSYSFFLEKRDAFFAAQEKREQSLSTQVKREVEWLRAGVLGRGAKASGRIKTAGKKIKALSAVQGQLAEDRSLALDLADTGRRSKKLIEAQRLAKTLGGQSLFRDLDIFLGPGIRLGIIGNNGSGKTTLMRILAQEMEPDAGRVKHALWLKVAVFGQHRQQLDKDLTLRRALAPNGDEILFRGRPMHVVGWAKRFLFKPEQLDARVETLSGGEQARVLIAGIMRQPADVLMLDEPTNDLDIPTLEVLEESLLAFPGAIVLITHDRHMLDRVCTHFVGLHGKGRCDTYGDVGQWYAVEAQLRKEERAAASAEKATRASAAGSKKTSKRKLSYNDQRELGQIEEEIPLLEKALASLRKQLEEPALLADHQKMHEHCSTLHDVESKLETLYERWHALEEKQGH